MYRIDENTYIDDSLVTCAEYQLFIDEMRKKGEFCQPDHWTSYQFPAGQALEPILGMRPSNASSFCLWLSQHEVGEWSYRLPTTNEAAEYPMIPKDKKLFGYWTLDAKEPSFSWYGVTPDNPRRIDFSYAFTHELAHERAQILKRTAVIDSFRLFTFGDIVLNILNIFLLFTLFRGDNLSRCLKRVNTVSRTNSLNLDNTFDGKVIFKIDHIIQLARDLIIISDYARSHYHAIYMVLNLGRELSSAIGHDVSMNILTVFTICVDLFTLRERIAGRSPAFEGIRLVKTRAGSQEHSA